MGLHSRSSTRVRMMSRVALLLPLIAAASAAPEARFSCEECVREMHGLAAMVKMGAIPTLDYTAAQHFCEDSLSKYYVGMLFGVVEHYFGDGALHVCQTSGTCAAREYTCDECVQGLEWVEMYLEDPYHDRGVQDLPRAELLPERLGRLQAVGGGALHCDARDGHGEVLHPRRDLHAGARVRRKPNIPSKAN